MVVAELNARERPLNKEIGLEVTLLKAELESEKSKSEFGFNVALGLVKTQYLENLIDKTLPQYRGKTETIIHLKIRFKILMKLLRIMLVGISGDINSGKDVVGRMFQYLTSEYQNKYSFENWLDRVDKYKSDPYSPIEIKFADKLKDMVCVLLSCTREKLEDREFKNTPLGEHWRKWYYTAESEVFVNNPTGRNKLVFSSEEACLLHIRTNKYWLLHSKSAYTIQSEILTLGFLCN
jgi:hypothetical protein